MILACQNIAKAFGTEVILKNASFHIEEQEKAAIVGINGAGKSTLLKIIVGELAPDEGMVTISRGKTLGYLEQHQEMESDATIYETLLSEKKDLLDMEQELRRMELSMKIRKGSELESLMENYNRTSMEFERRNGYAVQSEVVGVLKGLGFAEGDFSKKVNTLSGGQKTRVALGKLLLSQPDILLLDEPVNHLDMNSIAWLENYLLNYSGAVLIVAHDRYFLNKVATRIFEIENGVMTAFAGNYTAYAEKKAMLRDIQWKAYLNQQQEIRHQEAVIAKLKSFNREKSIKRAESREKMLGKIDVLEKPAELDTEMRLHFTPSVQSGNDVLKVENLSKRYGTQQLFAHLNFEIHRGEKVAIIGDNGTGKTTILKIINQLAAADEGSVIPGSKVKIAYYDQEHQVLHMDKILMDEIGDTYPKMTNTQIRNLLAAFLFTGDDVFKRVKDLSGGERGRLSLAKLMVSSANFLILDEPTNHLDITSKEILEEAIRHYTGTVLYVSHDRYFINQTASRILELRHQTLINYIGNYDYYLEKAELMGNIYAGSTASSASAAVPLASAASSKEDWARKKEEQAQLRKKQNAFQKTEKEINDLEERDHEIDELLGKEEIFRDVKKCIELTREKEELAEHLEELYERWESLSEELSE